MDTTEEHESDLQSQIEEVEALSSIYGDEWCVIDEASRIFCIRISDDTQLPKWTVCLQIILPPEYPSSAPPMYQINAAWLRGQDRMTLSNSLEELYVENAGENILYLWVEKIREFLVEKPQSAETEKKVVSVHMSHPQTREDQLLNNSAFVVADGPETNKTVTTEQDHDEDVIQDYRLLQVGANQSADFISGTSDDEELPPIQHGETITDRRSTFQPHLAPVVTPKQVQVVLNKLCENKKIASATHNIYAYRIYCEEKNSFLQDCEDDGETAAGGRLLHLLQILDVHNVLVVVSRWYGGIQLGPDRFKHINNCARNILVQEGYTDTSEDASKAGGKNKRPKSKKAK